MSNADIGPGTPLVCVDASNILRSSFKLTEGAIYVCQGLEKFQDPSGVSYLCDRDQCGYVGLYLTERPTSIGNWKIAYCPNRFRPLNDGSTDKLKDEEPLGYEQQLELEKAEQWERNLKPERVA